MKTFASAVVGAGMLGLGLAGCAADSQYSDRSGGVSPAAEPAGMSTSRQRPFVPDETTRPPGEPEPTETLWRP
jgi:hypothetical protein